MDSARLVWNATRKCKYVYLVVYIIWLVNMLTFVFIIGGGGGGGGGGGAPKRTVFLVNILLI
jgi:hypothetical protein